MSVGSKLRIESKGMLVALVFYAIVGVVYLVLLPIANFPPHIGIIATLSLVVAYGLFRKRIWTVWLIVLLSFVSTTFSSFVVYNVLAKDYILGLGMIAYLVVTWVFAIYVAAKRKTLES